MSPSSNMFKPIFPQKPVATVILVENSEAMSHIWSDLQDQYLNKLVDSLVVANPFIPPTVLVLESYACLDHGSNSPLPLYSGYYDGLRDLKFNYTPENRISVGIVNGCIDLLDSERFQGQNLALHLIVVAATTPSDEINGKYSPNFSPWLHLAQKLAKNNIYCHIITNPQQDMTSLNMLFEQTLRLQKRIETTFPVDPKKIVLRLSAQPIYGGYTESASSNSYPPQRIIPGRRDSYPLDNFHSEFDDASKPAAPNENDPGPSLVTQLQQVHGLTKKKVYGTKPQRQPFFRDDRVRDKYRKAPTPLTMPSSVTEDIHSPTAGGKVVPQSRADRMNRDLHQRRQEPWTRRGSGLSTPELETMPSPATTSAIYDLSPGSPYVPSDISSPVTPVTMTEESYNLSPATLPAYQLGVVPEQNWPQQRQYHSGHHNSLPQKQYFPPQISNFYPANGHIIQHSDMQSLEQQPCGASSHSPNSYSNYAAIPMLTPPIVPTQAYPKNDTPVTGITASADITSKDNTKRATKPSTRSSKKTVVSEEDEERFMFGQEFVAATAALFDSEVLPAYPNFPGMSSGLMSSKQGMLLHLTASQAGELYASRVRLPGVQQRQQVTPSDPAPLASVHPTNGLVMSSHSSASHPTSHQPQSSSSLTGWAG